MASLQSAPNMAPGNFSLPPNLTQQHVQEVLQKFKQMQEQGVRSDDPEYQKAHQLLAMIQRQQMMKQKQRQQQAQQMNGAVPDVATNGVHVRNASASSVPSATPDVQSAASQSQNAARKGPTVGSGSFSSEQLATLRNQIMAFKTLSKNQPIAPALHQQLFPSKKVQTPTPADKIASAEKTLDNVDKSASGQAQDSTGATAPPKDWYESARLPEELLHKVINYEHHSHRINRPRVPAFETGGLDWRQIRENRETLVYNRMASRMKELQELSASIGVWDTGKSDAPTGDDSLKLKALIELKSLSLWGKQQALREKIRRTGFDCSETNQTNRASHRRMKRPSLREARITEKLEKQQRDARETREKKKQYDQLQAILNHGAELVNASAQNRSRSVKLGRMMLSHHQHMEREEQKRVERTAKQRLQALKANDEETYLKLLGQAKDSRISHLLKQTDKFLKELASSVRQQQRNQAERYGDGEDFDDEEEEIADSDDEEEEEESGKKKIDYYAVAHRIREQVTEQPSILVGGTLKEYQLKGLQWMISLYNNNLNGILADEMGLGKTIQTISLITHIIEKKRNNGPFLVIVPLSTLTNWNIEFDKWAPSVTKVVYKGPPNARKQQQQQIRWGNFQVLLTTYEYIIKDRPILAKIKWAHMIVDEGHRMKNANSKLSSTLSQYYTSRYRLILTGTPLQNNLPELWALLNFVLPNIFKSVKSFDEWFNTPFANTGGQDRMDLSEEEQLLVIRRLHKVLRPFLLRRLKKDVEKDLPDKQERVIKCRFSALQAKLYKQLVTHNRMAVSDGKGGKTNVRGLSNMLMQLRKLCNHPFVFEPVEDQMNPSRLTNDLLWRTAGKFELLDRILPKFRATGHRVLMFFQMTQIMNIMEDFLRMRGLKYLRLDGSTKSDDRSDLLKVFNDPGSEYFCFLLSTRAGGLGLNLQTADTVIIYDSDWNPHQDLQAQDRAHRIGQKNEVRILRLISSNSVEEKILERAQFKLDMDGKVIQAGKFDNKSTNEERDALLRTLMDSAEAADQIGEQEEMDDDDLNEIMARSEEEIGIFQEIDRKRLETDEYGPGKRYPRLMCEEELPDIYMQEDEPVAEVTETEVYGRGARERKVKRYDDGMTEEQFLRTMEDLEENPNAVSFDERAEQFAREREERQARKEKRKLKAQGLLESSPDPSIAEDAEVEVEVETPPRKPRRRGPPPSKRKAEEPAEETPQPKRKRGRQPKVPDTLSSAERATLTTIVNSVMQSLKDMEQEIQLDSSDSEEGPIMRAVIEPFMKPPPRSQYPDYYKIIQNPIAVETIEKKIKRDDYQSLKEFRNDIHLLCQNARTYNEDGSILFQDANDIEAKCLSELKKLTEDYPDFANFDGDSAADGQSVGAISGADTPLTASTPGQPKLKLTFSNPNAESASSLNGAGADDE
ncbi:Chromatin structure-remodeling complex subunit snf21 [Penicillium macrosclerotiorum]|uniref:Chromatin structure-remodeling complex subunit snf21 n=1 Tax=Penicillium macrosclerotiorum TaxID=303699 RepID=UPI0025470B83|nr:Chromatin structure-remodeling complex subunit snf21 [Penicillium macrosclerotiorum]KAJ5689163.1 Chromatin structure-remodeling complex subunit snf21 [Penicillium macrosclerotiorum]